jgi:hypothetical protein
MAFIYAVVRVEDWQLRSSSPGWLLPSIRLAATIFVPWLAPSVYNFCTDIVAGTAFREVRGKLFPSVGMMKPGEHVWVNFGQSPFEFDIDSMILVSTRPSLPSYFIFVASIPPSIPPTGKAPTQWNVRRGIADTGSRFSWLHMRILKLEYRKRRRLLKSRLLQRGK